MVILRFKTSSDKKELLKKIKKMYKFTKDLKECIEDELDEMEDEDVDYREEDYDYDEMERPHHRGMSSRGGGSRYRRGM